MGPTIEFASSMNHVKACQGVGSVEPMPSARYAPVTAYQLLFLTSTSQLHSVYLKISDFLGAFASMGRDILLSCTTGSAPGGNKSNP